jgi:hypothetical protein
MAKAPKMSKKGAGRGGKSGDAGSKKDEALLKPKKRSARVERILKKREPQLVEGPKNALIMKGHKTSQTITDVLRDLGKLTKPHNKLLSRKNEILPFEDANSIEFLAPKNDCSLFALGSHSKKRPNNLTLVSVVSLFTLYIFSRLYFTGPCSIFLDTYPHDVTCLFIHDYFTGKNI